MTEAATTIPRHVGIILDGNRRWAKEQNLPSLEGHKRGADVIEPVVKEAFGRGVKYVSIFLFSTENWKRAEKEVGYLMKLFIHYFKKDGKRLVSEGYKILFAGRTNDSQLRSDVRKAIQELEDTSTKGTAGTLVINFNYGGQNEIVDAVKAVMKQGVDEDEVNPELLSQHMYHPSVPDLDLIIRSSGEHRLSGFQLWRAAYAEFIFANKHWPDFGPTDMIEALHVYSERNRRFGG